MSKAYKGHKAKYVVIEHNFKDGPFNPKDNEEFLDMPFTKFLEDGSLVALIIIRRWIPK